MCFRGKRGHTRTARCRGGVRRIDLLRTNLIDNDGLNGLDPRQSILRVRSFEELLATTAGEDLEGNSVRSDMSSNLLEEGDRNLLYSRQGYDSDGNVR